MAGSLIDVSRTREDHASWRARTSWRRVAEIVAAVLVLAISGVFLLRAVRAGMRLSLWQDELFSITLYSSRGAGHTATTYTANNHIFFNLLNALTPGSGSVDPARARLWSIVATVATPLIGLVELSRRGMVLAGALLFAVFATSTPWLEISLQARGYGLLGLAAMAIVMAVWQHLEKGRVPSLVVVSAASVIGCWTVPSFAFFVGPMWLAFLAVRRTRQVLVAAVAAGVVTVIVYLPVAGQLIDEFTGYGSQFGERFRGMQDVNYSVHAYLMGLAGTAVVIAWAVAAIAVLAVASGWPAAVGRALRDEMRILVVSVVAFFVICMIVRSVPPRVTAFASVALAVAAAASLGALARQTSIRPVQIVSFVVLLAWAATTIWSVQASDSPGTWIPQEDWKGAGDYLADNFPAGTKVFADPKSGNIAGYLRRGQTFARTFDPEAFARGEMVIVGYRVSEDKVEIDPGSPFVETDLRQVRGKFPPHAMRIRYAPAARAGVRVTVDGQATPELTDGRLSTQFTSPPQKLLPEPYDIVVDVPDGRWRSIAIGVGDNQPPKLMVVSIVGPDGTTTNLPKDAMTKSVDVLTVDLGDREISQVRIAVGRSTGGPFTLSDIWVYPLSSR